jgi:hypothetical protein
MPVAAIAAFWAVSSTPCSAAVPASFATRDFTPRRNTRRWQRNHYESRFPGHGHPSRRRQPKPASRTKGSD